MPWYYFCAGGHQFPLNFYIYTPHNLTLQWDIQESSKSLWLALQDRISRCRNLAKKLFEPCWHNNQKSESALISWRTTPEFQAHDNEVNLTFDLDVLVYVFEIISSRCWWRSRPRDVSPELWRWPCFVLQRFILLVSMLAKLNPCAGRTTFTGNYCRDSCNTVMLAVM